MPRGLSLHIGVNRYNDTSYASMGRFLRFLPNCNRDAVAFFGIAQRFRYDKAIFIDEEATAENVLRGIEVAARHLEYGDTFFLTFSGHGCRFEDKNNDEDDGYDEAWCLHNTLIKDDDLYERWKMFRPGVRILVVADCCHSGTSVKNTEELRASNRKQLIKKNGNDLQASVLLMAACQDAEVAYAGINLTNSLYTYCMLTVLQQYDFCKSYSELHEKIYQQMPQHSKPKIFALGPQAAEFQRSRPFKI